MPARKQTSTRVSKIAGRVLRLIEDGAVFEMFDKDQGKYLDYTGMIGVLAGSALGQREAKPKKRAKKGRK